MKAFLALVALPLGASSSLAQDKPINALCPVKGKPAKANLTTTYQGKTIGFC